MKKNKLLKLKERLLSSKNESEEVVFLSFMKEAELNATSPYDIGEAFMFYNLDKRRRINEAKQRHSRIEKSDIIGATQFFTPKALSEYLAEKTLKELDTHKPFKILDPALGTGNLLLAAYDALEKKGMKGEDILSSFYGLDLDKRAVDVAKKILLKRSGLAFFPLKLYSFEQPFKKLAAIALEREKPELKNLLALLCEVKEAGSLTSVSEAAFSQALELKKEFSEEFGEIFSIIEILFGKYDRVLMNPPYLSSSDFGLKLKEYIDENYYDFRQDIFSAFTYRYCEALTEKGRIGILCPYNWMYIKSFSNLRRYVLDNFTITDLTQLPYDGYSYAVVYLSAFSLSNEGDGRGEFIRKFKDGEEKKYLCSKERFYRTPNNSLIFWGSEAFIENFKAHSLGEYLDIRQGMATGDNKKYLKKLSEVDCREVDFTAKSLKEFIDGGKKYALYSKGGRYRKWYGNLDYVIAFGEKERKELSKRGNKMPSRDFYFREGITWTLVSSKGHFGARYVSSSVFDVGGSCGFIRENSPVSLYVALGYLCSKVATYYLNALNPTLNVQVGDLKNLPFILPDEKNSELISNLVRENVEISKRDWQGEGLPGDFERVKENEEKINSLFIKLYGLEGELDPTVEDRLITLKSPKA